MEMKLLLLQLQVSAAVLLVWLLRQGMKKLPGTYSYILWILVFARLLFPMALETRFSFMPSAEQSGAWVERLLSEGQPEKEGSPGDSAEVLTRENGYRYELSPGSENSGTAAPNITAETENFNPEALNSELSKSQAFSPETERRHRIPGWLWAGWMPGAICILARNGILLSRMKHKVKYACLSEENNIYISQTISVPFTLGIFFPRIYLPASLKGTEKEYILCHEKVHIRRKDHLVKNIAFLLLAVNWYNPFVWMAYHYLECDMEMSCDEKVIRLMGPHIKRQYSQSLLNFAAGNRRIASTPLTFGANDVKRRIRNVLSCRCEEKKRNGGCCRAAGIFLFLITGIMLFTTGVSQASSSDPAGQDAAGRNPTEHNMHSPEAAEQNPTEKNTQNQNTAGQNPTEHSTQSQNTAGQNPTEHNMHSPDPADQREGKVLYSEEGLTVYYSQTDETLFWSREKGEKSHFVYPYPVSAQTVWCIRDEIMYFTVNSEDPDFGRCVERICVLDLATGLYDNETYILKEKGVTEENISLLSVSLGYLILYQKHGNDIIFPLINTGTVPSDSTVFWKDRAVTDLKEQERNAYGSFIREYLLGHPGQLLDISNRTSDETYVLIDMDGDGRAEKISLSRDPEAPEEAGYLPYDCYQLQAERSKVTGKAVYLSNRILAFSPDGSRIFLALCEDGASEGPETFLFTYASGEFQETGRLPDDIRYCTIENGTILTSRVRYDSMIPLYVKELYRLNTEGMLESESQEIYDVAACSGELMVSLPVHDSPGSEIVYYLEPQSVTLTKIDSTGQWLYLEGENGEEGWFLTDGDKGSRIVELNLESSEVFEMYYAG